MEPSSPAADRAAPAVEIRKAKIGRGIKVKKTCAWNNWRLNTPDKKV